jgi:hypothetical protein
MGDEMRHLVQHNFRVKGRAFRRRRLREGGGCKKDDVSKPPLLYIIGGGGEEEEEECIMVKESVCMWSRRWFMMT